MILSIQAIIIYASTLLIPCSNAFILLDFQNTDKSGFTVHFDSKLLPDIVGNKKVDRLPIAISHGDYQQLLCVQKIPSGSRSNIALATYDALDENLLLDKVDAARKISRRCCSLGAINGKIVTLCALSPSYFRNRPACCVRNESKNCDN